MPIARRRPFCVAALVVGVLLGRQAATQAAELVEPHVFTSSGGVLDLLIVAKPKAVQTIAYPPPGGGTPIHPVGWVYEICPRPASVNECPAAGNTVSDYGGVRLALQPGDTLKIRLVNKLPALDPAKVKHLTDPGGANLYRNPTNLHTHGLIVPPRVPTMSDPTFGDYVFVDIYNSANGLPKPQPGHQHGSVKMDYADYRIDIPANHPAGMFWFHPHVHGITLNQLTAGMSGVISIGDVRDYVEAAPSVVRHMILKDMQVLAAGQLEYDSGTVTVVDGEVQYQQSGDFCEQRYEKGPHSAREGFCEGAPGDDNGFINNYVGGRWYFTINGQVYPTVRVTSSDGEIWRLTNASAQISYRLNLVDDATSQPMAMQLVAIDGVSIDVPPGTSAGTIMQKGGNKFTVVACPSSSANSLAVCVKDLVMMPASRADVWVTYRNADGVAVAPPPGATATLLQGYMDLGPAGEKWPGLFLAKVEFAEQSAAKTTLNVTGNARAALSPRGVFGTPAKTASATARPTVGCQPLASGHRRRIFFGVDDPSDANAAFGLGYEEVDAEGTPVPGTQIPVIPFDPNRTIVCVPLGPGGAPVRETWEIVNLATEIHNFHMHQTKFTVLDATELSHPSFAAADAPVIMEDNVPLPYATAKSDTIMNDQGGYCTIAQWRSGECASKPLVLDIPFSEIGEFAYHCHISEHSDGGMMAKIKVVPEPISAIPSAHDFNGDGVSDVAWRDDGGNTAMWLMNGPQVSWSTGLGSVSKTWSVVGQRDFDGDGKHDWLWRHTGGSVAIWFMSGTQVARSTVFTGVSTAWTIAGTGDFNGDGKGDVLWRHTGGSVALWLMNGSSLSASANIGLVSTAWSIAGTGDFDGDGKRDILWRDASGNVALWLMNGATVTQAVGLGGVSTAWSIVGTGDFDGDGKYDVLWRDTNGNVAVWLMNGSKIAQQGGLGAVPTSWTIAETGDFNGDGKSDILWRHGDGDVALWLLDGVKMSSAQMAGRVATSWVVQGLNAD